VARAVFAVGRVERHEGCESFQRKRGKGKTLLVFSPLFQCLLTCDFLFRSLPFFRSPYPSTSPVSSPPVRVGYTDSMGGHALPQSASGRPAHAGLCFCLLLLRALFSKVSILYAEKSIICLFLSSLPFSYCHFPHNPHSLSSDCR